MIEPVLKDEPFLQDVAAAPSEPQVLRIWWLGQSGYLLHFMEDFLAIDPYLSDSLTKKYEGTQKPHVRISPRVVDPARLNFVRAILSTHNHTDHLDAETLGPMLAGNASAKVIAPVANLEMVSARTGRPPDELWGSDDGVEHVVGPFRITGVPAAHPNIDRDEQGRHRYLGYVIRAGNYTIYHSGDTMVYDGMAARLREFGRIDIALLPINGKVGNMDGAAAARLAKEVGAKLVIPCHYDLFEFNTADPQAEFVPECERLGQRYRILRLGGRWSSTEMR